MRPWVCPPPGSGVENPVKIALVSPFTLPVCRGNSLTVQRLFEGLRSRGHAVCLFNSTDDAPENLDAFAPDIVHSLHALYPLDWLLRSGVPGSYPWVATLTGTDYTSEVHPARMQTLAAVRSLIVFHEEAAQSVRERWPQFADRLHIIAQSVVVPECADRRESFRRELGIAPDAIVLCMAGGIRPVKNIGLALKAFDLFTQTYPEARLLLAGPRLDEAESARLLSSGRRIDGFSYLGALPHARVLELLQAADIFLNTSLHEGMPGAVMEAMAAGLAVVATDVSGNRSLIDHSRTGMLVHPDAVRELAQACAVLASSPALRQHLGRAARQKMQTHFSCAVELQAHEQLYAKVIAQ
jgi:glycosyltransferase involved in cell wall biosynthesis